MTIDARFHAALVEVAEPELAGPELLPVRLARACARMLQVDGAGICLQGGDGEWLPLGASCEDAATAERLQFTVGGGPCTTAEESGEPVFAVAEDLRRRWPLFTDLLVGATPYRAVVALPLQLTLAGAGALDLFFERPDEVTDLEVFEAMAVGELVTSALSDAALWFTWSPERGPEWLHGPTPRRRAAVWEAMGKLGMELTVDAPAALALIRARAYADGRSADDVAADLLDARLSPADLG